MKKNSKNYMLPTAGVLMFVAATGSAQELQKAPHYMDSTNRISASLRFGFNIKGKFTGVGSAFTSGSPFGTAHRPLTPDGDHYNYDNGYVLTDISGNAGGVTTYWGFDSADQVNVDGNTVDFNRTVAVAAGWPGEDSGDDSPYLGGEVVYNYQFGVIESWNHMSYGLEAAVNFMPIGFGGGRTGSGRLMTVTDTYSHQNSSQDLADNAPYQGTYGGNGFWLDVPSIGSSQPFDSGSANFVAQQRFDANLWGFRLGPYIDVPLSEKWSLHFSGGLAVGLLDSRSSWTEVLGYNSELYGQGSLTATGGGNNFDTLWGYYIGLEAAYQINNRWGIQAGGQFQDLGVYSHRYGTHGVELDLSQSIFVHVGISYSF